jgi:hypothetical protein
MDSPRTVTYTATRRSTVRKLTRDELCELVAGYKAGATVYELAEQFKIHRVTVSDHLHRQGTCLRGGGLSDEHIVQAADLYRSGWSIAKLGPRFNVDPTTVWRALRANGVEMRKPYERARQLQANSYDSP